MTKAGMVNISDIAREAALEAIKIYKQQEKERTKRTRLHNTGLLLENYIGFLDHYEKIKFKASDIQEDLDQIESDIVELDDIIIQSIKRSKIRTKIMISQIETAMAMVQAKMKAKGEEEKCNVIRHMYMDRSKKDIRFNQRVKLVADELHCSESSVRRWNSEMLNELSVLLFGVDGLRLDV